MIPQAHWPISTSCPSIHVFIEWQADAERIRRAARISAQRGRILLLTVEPWPFWRWNQGGAKPPVLADISGGKYEGELRRTCREVSAIGRPTLVRFGHEMDDRSGRYPWAGALPDDFIAAYRHMVSTCRKIAPNARFVWSPIGESSATSYYPGAEYVDYIGLSMFASEPFEKAYFNRLRSATEMVLERYERVAPFGKPIILAELGVSGSQAYVQRWFYEFGRVLKTEFPLIRAAIYFNMPEPHQSPEPFGAPDWTAGAKAFFDLR